MASEQAAPQGSAPGESGPPESKAEERGLERLILFSDAVVAIAITLLVLPLTELKPTEDQATWEFLREHADELLSFAISFLVIARFWFAHHAMFQTIIRMDRNLLLINTAWLASVVVLPFPTALLAERGYYATMYLANLLLTSALTSALSEYISRHPRLLEDPAARAQDRRAFYATFVTSGVILLALIASLFWENSALLLLILMPIVARVAHQVSQRGEQTG